MAVAQLNALVAAIDALSGVDPADLADEESVLLLERCHTRTEAIVTRAVGAFQQSELWHNGEARNAADWLVHCSQLPSRVARRQLRLAEYLEHLPAFEQHWVAGDVNGAHVEVVGRIRRFENEDQLAELEETMCGWNAEGTPFRSFCRAVHSWNAEYFSKAAEALAARQREDREVWLGQADDGAFVGKIQLDSISGAIVHNELFRLEEQLFQADWKDAHAALGREPNYSDLARTREQRLADALTEMATRSAATPAGSRRPQPLFTVLVNYEELHGRICELAQGISVTPGSLVPWLEEAMIERAVFGPANRVEISEKSRLFTGATRRALEVRDRECQHPICHVPAERCEADHITPYSEGGLTVQENGRMLCGFHNRLRSRTKGDGGCSGDNDDCLFFEVLDDDEEDERPPPDSS
ncbi:MAG TPA: DUF222 domain-containing protein [Acidimicrobiales bacterium]|jgi:hypothetical protein